MMKSVTIGNSTAKNGVFLAPMAGFTDAVFRRICRRYGADYAVSEMISAAAIHFGDKKTASLAYLAQDDAPTAIQLFGHTPEYIAEAVRKIGTGELWENAGDGEISGTDGAKRAFPAAVDINMGCPVKKIAGSGDGSTLMRSPELCGEIVRAAVEAARDFSLPVTVKIRLGIDGVENAPQVAKICASSGASAIFVHGRTREQMYSGEASLDGIARVRDAVDPSIPVIGNGDVCSRESAERMICKTGCDGVMIGRAALSAPWVFAAIADADFVPPTEDERRMLAYEAVGESCRVHGESVGIPMSRARAGYLLAGMRDSASMRREINCAATLDEVRRILKI